MRGNEKVSDVIIIGGGLVGCSMAYYLSREGVGVALFEKRNISSGASGRCGGMVVQADGREEKTIESRRFLYTRENNKLLEGLEQDLHYEFDYRQIGSLDIACSELEWEQLKEITALQKHFGDDEVQLLDGMETRDLCPVLGPSVRGSRYRASDGSLNANKLTLAYARAALKFDAKIHPYTPVMEIIIEGDVARGVRLGDGIAYSDLVVNATNAWASYLTPQLEIVPCKGSAIVTEPVTRFPALVWEAYPDGTMIWGAQHSEGNILFGSAPETGLHRKEDHYGETVFFEDIEKAVKRFNTLFPGLSEVSVIRSWAGTVAFTADSLPCLGRIPGIENLIVNAGFPVGMSWCPIMGKLGSEFIINRGTTSLPIDMFAPSRFAGRTVDWPQDYNYTILQDFINRL